MINNIAIIGSSGALGSAFVNTLSDLYKDANIYAFSRNQFQKSIGNIHYNSIDYMNEDSIKNAALIASENNMLDLVIIATGVLHNKDFMPEKSLKELSAEKFRYLFEINTILPAIIAKYFLPVLSRNNKSIFAALSARVGSISDNQLGGWYAYRASKSALNMIIKNASIEVGRTNKAAIIVGLHPGTVDSKLSKPFQKNVKDGKLFDSEFSATKLIEVLQNLSSKDSGKYFAWDGEEIKP